MVAGRNEAPPTASVCMNDRLAIAPGLAIARLCSCELPASFLMLPLRWTSRVIVMPFIYVSVMVPCLRAGRTRFGSTVRGMAKEKVPKKILDRDGGQYFQETGCSCSCL